jgi:hypothetical protein
MFLAGWAFVLLAAGAPGSAAWGEAPADACTLLTPAEVNAALGVQVDPGHGLVPHICSWTTLGPLPKGVTLILYPTKKFDHLKTLGYGNPKTSVSGVGDAAAFGSIPNYAATLLVRKGDVVFLVRAEGFGFEQSGAVPPAVERMEKTLAQVVLSKL